MWKVDIRVVTLFTLFLSSFLSGCTAFYQRDFLVIPQQQLTVDEKHEVFTQFRQHLVEQGYQPINETQGESGERVSFQIRSAVSRVMPTSRINDSIGLTFTKVGDIEIDLSRVSSYPPDDFSEKYIANFITVTEESIRKVSGKNMSITVVNGK